MSEETKSLETRKREAGVKGLMGTEEGRFFVWRFLGDLGYGLDTFDSDPTISAYQQGRASAALMLVAEISSLVPDLYLVMQKEHLDEQRRSNTDRNDEQFTLFGDGGTD